MWKNMWKWYSRSCLSLTSPFITFKTSFQTETQIFLSGCNLWNHVFEVSNNKSSIVSSEFQHFGHEPRQPWRIFHSAVWLLLLSSQDSSFSEQTDCCHSLFSQGLRCKTRPESESVFMSMVHHGCTASYSLLILLIKCQHWSSHLLAVMEEVC